MTTNFSQTAAYIWSLAELLRGDFKQSQYGRVILPFTILRRLECVLAPRKEVVLKEVEKLASMRLEEEAREKFEHFRFNESVGTLNEANLLFKVVQRVSATDLSPNPISNHEMGLVFEELINAMHLHQKMRKSLGSKRHYIDGESLALITKTFGGFESYRLEAETDVKSNRGRQPLTAKKGEKKAFGSKIFTSHEVA